MATKHYEPVQDSPRESPAAVAARIAQGGQPAPHTRLLPVRSRCIDDRALRPLNGVRPVDVTAELSPGLFIARHILRFGLHGPVGVFVRVIDPAGFPQFLAAQTVLRRDLFAACSGVLDHRIDIAARSVLAFVRSNSIRVLRMSYRTRARSAACPAFTMLCRKAR